MYVEIIVAVATGGLYLVVETMADSLPELEASEKQ